MNCPECHTKTTVYSTKPTDAAGNINPDSPVFIKRYHYCPQCHFKFATYQDVLNYEVVSAKNLPKTA